LPGALVGVLVWAAAEGALVRCLGGIVKISGS
jgi:hypothetical protein